MVRVNLFILFVCLFESTSLAFRHLNVLRARKHYLQLDWTTNSFQKNSRQTAFYASPSNGVANGFDWKGTKRSCEDKLQKCVESLQLQFQTIRVGVANPMMLDRVSVDYHGVPTALNQVARVNVNPSNSQQLLVEPFEKNSLPNIEKAILMAELNLTPQSDGNLIRINIPPLTEERRKELVKQAKSMVESSKIALRNVRRDFVEKVKNAEKRKEIGKDENKTYQDDIQKVTDAFTKKVDDLMKAKEKDLLKV